MKPKLIDAYMKTAEIFAECSTATRLHVGAIVVKDDRIISIGYNGMPSGWTNECEYEVTEFQTEYGVGSKLVKTGELKTKPEVLHAETNAIAKLAKSTESGMGATMFITHAPCLDCAKLIYQSGISSVLYRNTYRDIAGVVFLKNSGIEVEQV
jgi:dCMP deaminase